jgi:hypothetical protein
MENTYRMPYRKTQWFRCYCDTGCTVRLISLRAGIAFHYPSFSVLILLLSYIVAGVLYRRYALGYRGFDQFPRISLIPLSDLPHSFADVLDWFRDIRDHLRGGARDLWPRSGVNGGPRSGGWTHRDDGFSPLAREEEEAMFRDGPDGPDARFSLEDEADLNGAQELVDSNPPVPAKDADDAGPAGGPIRL